MRELTASEIWRYQTMGILPDDYIEQQAPAAPAAPAKPPAAAAKPPAQ